MKNQGPMLRILIIAIGFFAITAGLLLLQPGTRTGPDLAQGQPAPATKAQVSRAETGLELLATTPGMAPAGGTQENRDPLAAAVARAAASAARATSGQDDLASLTAGVLADLGAPSGKQSGDDDLRNMTSGVLASLGAATRPAATADQAPQKLETLIAQALRQGQSDAYLDALLNEAAARGEVSLPKALVTEEGKLDTATLLATLVKKSPAPATPQINQEAIAGGPGVEVRVVQRAGQTVQYNFYTVQAGDSLGAIAHKFYGDARLYSAIFKANRQFLSSPDRIRPGQRLTIPALRAS